MRKYVIAFLLMEINFKRIWFVILRHLTGLKALTYLHPFDNFDENIREGELQGLMPVCEVMNPSYVLIRDKKLECSTDFKNTIDHLEISVPNVEISPSFECLIKWTKIDLLFITQCRKYFLLLFIELKSLLNNDLSFWANLKVKEVSPDEIELDRRVRTTEEIIELYPYTRLAKKSLLYKIPVFKKPVYRLCFSKEQMDGFREMLAQKADTRKTNIEIVSIYDKFNLENYSGIKQDSDNKGLYCYLNTKQNLTRSDTMYYLIIGQKKDTKEIVKGLAVVE